MLSSGAVRNNGSADATGVWNSEEIRVVGADEGLVVVSSVPGTAAVTLNYALISTEHRRSF